jgi:hypothetical protein
VIGAYRKRVGRFDGFVPKYMGDGVLAFSGIRARTRTRLRGWSGPCSGLIDAPGASISDPSSSKRGSEWPPGWWEAQLWELRAAVKPCPAPPR